VSFKPL
jgi:hypothetical protein